MDKSAWPSECTDAERMQYGAACREFGEHTHPETLVGNLLGHIALHERVVKPALGRISGAHKVLDFGCGVGRVTGLLVKPNRVVLGVDVSRPALIRAAQLVPDAGFVWVSGMGDLPFPPESFDAVVSMITLQHLQFFPVRHTYFTEFARVLRPQGRLLIQLNADVGGPSVRWFDRGRPDAYSSKETPDVVCVEEELVAYLPPLGFVIEETWRTEMDTQKLAWHTRMTGRKDGWLWVLARKEAA